MARGRKGDHKWTDGQCEHCAMRSHWAGAKDPCPRDAICKGISNANLRWRERNSQRNAALKLKEKLAQKHRERAQEVARRIAAGHVPDVKSGSGNDLVAYKLRQKRADIFALILEGHYTSIRKAAVEAGLRKY